MKNSFEDITFEFIKSRVLFFEVLGVGASCIELDAFRSMFSLKAFHTISEHKAFFLFKQNTNSNVVMRITIDNGEVTALLAPAAHFEEDES